MNQRAFIDWLLLAGFCAFLFFFGLNYFGLVGADEPRYAQVAREMLARHDWITPTLGGTPWLEKPALYYWQTMLAYRMFGVSDWSARLPSATDATITVFAVYLFLSRFRRGFQLDGALMTASAAAVVGFARAASMDMPLAASFTLALLGWYAWYESGEKLYLAGSYLCLALAALAKGPVAPLLWGIVVLVFAAVQRDFRLLSRTLRLPGILLFCVVALPWYVAVQVRNPDFFHIFILQHNLARFGTNLYHHIQPFWYYLPVMLLALMPWTVFVMAATIDAIRAWWSEGVSLLQSGDALNAFLMIWLLVPGVFFSFSQSKLPGYILPAAPAGTLLLAEYLRRHIAADQRPSRGITILHAMVATMPFIPALMIQHILMQHRLPWSMGTLFASLVAGVLAIGMIATIESRPGLRTLRFVTLVPVVLVVAAALRIGGPALDATLSARPLVRELSAIETKPLPLAVFSVSRETEYGLAFYCNQTIYRYEQGAIPPGEHLLIAPESSRPEIPRVAVDRRVSRLGNFAPQHLDYYWVSAPGMGMEHHHELGH